MRELTFDLFLRYADRHYEENGEFLRYGQALANCLWAWRPNIYKAMPRGLDPFYDDSKVEDFLLWVSEQWATPPYNEAYWPVPLGRESTQERKREPFQEPSSQGVGPTRR